MKRKERKAEMFYETTAIIIDIPNVLNLANLDLLMDANYVNDVRSINMRLICFPDSLFCFASLYIILEKFRFNNLPAYKLKFCQMSYELLSIFQHCHNLFINFGKEDG